MESSSVSLVEVLNDLSISTDEQNWHAGWESSAVSYGSDPSFMSDDAIMEACAICGLSKQIETGLLQVAPCYRETSSVMQLLWHFNVILFQERSLLPTAIGTWPTPEGVPSPMLFSAYAMLSGAKAVRSRNRELGIDDAITMDTLSDIGIWLLEYQKSAGEWGLKESGWLASHFSGRLFKLGRLQFVPGTLKQNVHVFRNNASGETIFLCGAGVKIRRDGQIDGANGIIDKQAWTTNLTIGDEITGHPVDDGSVSAKATTLDAEEWTEILKQGDPILEVHIPATGSMKHEDCEASFDQAETFFKEKFQYAFRGFTCTSWLLDPQLAYYLKPESNIVRFLRSYHVVPIPNASDSQTMERVFGFGCRYDASNLTSAPQESTLQRAVIGHMRTGRLWRDACGIRLPRA